MKKFMVLLRMEALLFIRDFYGFFFTFVFPLLMLLLYGSIYGNEPSPYFGGRGDNGCFRTGLFRHDHRGDGADGFSPDPGGL